MPKDSNRSDSVLGHHASGPRLTGLGAALLVVALSSPFWMLLGIVALILR